MSSGSQYVKFIIKGVVRLQHFLISLIIITFLVAIIFIAIAFIIGSDIVAGRPINVLSLTIAYLIIVLIGLVPMFLYYDATKNLVKWRDSFSMYKTVAMLVIMFTIILTPFVLYIISSRVNELNNIINMIKSSEPEARSVYVARLIAELSNFHLYIALIGVLVSIIGTGASLYLIGILNVVREESLYLLSERSEYVDYREEFWRLSDSVKFLRASLILNLLTSIANTFQAYGVSFITGLIGLVLYIIGVVRAHGGLNEVKDFVEGISFESSSAS
jgi:hypothetical protein